MTKRIPLPLKRKILLCDKDKEKNKRYTYAFTVRKIIGGGVSAICYEAEDEKGNVGVLKEFYPENVEGLARDKDKQLIILKNIQKQFDEDRKEYIKPYNVLLEAKRNDKTGSLSSFLPFFAVYNGCDKSGNLKGTSYIWTPEARVVTFKKVCDEIHKHPDKTPEKDLDTILDAIINLADCTKILHENGLIHRDLKPENLGFVKRGNEILTQTVTIFDIDSICYIFSVPESVVFTKGYSEPETGIKKSNVKTDIFSIGAMLFNAVIINDRTRAVDFLYEDGFYNDLENFVDTSELITCSEANSNPEMKKAIVKILKESLCCREKRYKRCEEMLSDLNDAINILRSFRK